MTESNSSPTTRNPYWGEVLQNLSVFLSTSAILVKNLNEVINSSTTTGGSQGLQNNLHQNPQNGCGVNVCCPCPSGDKIIGADGGYNTFQNKLVGPPGMLPASTPNMPGNQFKIYEDVESCEQLKENNKAKSKQCPLAKPQSKKLGAKASKEQLGHLGKLKEDLRTAQNHLVLVDEQVRKMERLLQDYDSTNISGKVNPAALYREIVKPDQIPYRSNSKQGVYCVNPQQRQAFQSLPNSTNQGVQCTPCGAMRSPLSGQPPRTDSFWYGTDPNLLGTHQNQNLGINNKQNPDISILSAAPLDQNTLDSCLCPGRQKKMR